MSGNGTTIRDRRKQATGTQYIHPIARFPSIIVIGGLPIILTTLTRDKCSGPADLAYLAMTHLQLGHAKETEAELQLVRVRMKDPRWAQDAQAQGFLREAEALLLNPKTPGSK
jgi:hypothetical protein